uniref:Conserved oligomeric Golgi complex subunit 3 n=1 Tax=Salmo trutta TaxID=8032 RepID=A0A673YEP0_SALTR
MMMAYTDQSLLDLTDEERREKLSQWDRRTDKQTDSVHDIRAAAETLSIPADLTLTTGVCWLTLSCTPFSLKQSELVALTENIQQKLSYFNELENINTKLNPPTLSVNSEGSIPKLLKLDECIEYVSSHVMYLAKFQQCLSKNLTSQLTKRDPLGLTNADNVFTLCYVKFRMLIEQMEQRSERILDLSSTQNNHPQNNNHKHTLIYGTLNQSGCAFMFHVCQDEHQLEEVLELLCLSLYDVLRPLIIRGIHLETLSELCGILNNEMLEDHVHKNGTVTRNTKDLRLLLPSSYSMLHIYHKVFSESSVIRSTRQQIKHS